MSTEWIIDADAHVTEPPGVWIDRLPAKYREVAPTMRRIDDVDYWFINGKQSSLSIGETACAGWEKEYPRGPRNLDEVPRGAWDAAARLEYMDSAGIWSQVIYPNVGGFGSEQFLKMSDPELQLLCVQAYNDWLLEWCGTDSRRLLPVIATPFWDVTATVAEIERCAALGARGILFTGDPQSLGMETLGHPSWEPLWAAAQDTELPISFHVGSGNMDMESQAVTRRADGNIGKFAVDITVRMYLHNAMQVMDLLLSGVLPKFPGTKFVSVESGIGWVPFVLEALDFVAGTYRLPRFAPELKEELSEYFRRQVYVCYFYETFAPQHLVGAIGEDNILFETDYPHPTCQAGSLRDVIETGLQGQPERVRRKLLWENSAKLYKVELPVSVG